MTCEEARDRLPDYALGTLSETEGAAVRRHLRGCGGCRTDAAQLDGGVATFAGMTHVAEPPPHLERRVMAALADEWREVESPRRPARRFFLVPKLGFAAVVAALAGAVLWGSVAQFQVLQDRGDAAAYREALSVLGGQDLRVATLQPARPGVEASAVLYDSHRGLSWTGVFVFTKDQNIRGPLTVTISNPAGHSIEFPFPLEINHEGRGAAWLDTAEDISTFTTVTVTGPNGEPVAEGTAPVSEDEE
jgi:hypothetical protein